MCGIAGIIGPQAESERGERAISAMLRSLRHRGPDDEGLWRSASGAARMAHARLSIIDLSAAGRQPMSTPDGRFTIVFNGEIYNFGALRSDLERQNLPFRTHSDTEVILHLYAREGADGVRQLRGMFAFAIWDERERSCFLARDGFGIKPLYFSAGRNGLVFASEMRALLDSGIPSRTIDPAAAAGYFETGSVPEPLTMVKDVRCLPSGHTMLWKNGETSTTAFRGVAFPEPSPPPANPPGYTRAALLDSVHHHFVSDVPVGIFLSGGMDSTALLALARLTEPGQLQTYSVAVEDAALDESAVAQKTASHFQTDHHEMRLSAEVSRAMFDKFLASVDQPSIDGFNTFVVSSLARERGAKVVLSGLGGDELFGGYASFWKVPGLFKACRTARSVPFAGDLASAILRSPRWSSRIRRLGSLLQREVTLGDVYRSYRGIYAPEEARKLAAHLTGATESEASWSGAMPRSTDSLDAISELELTQYMRNQLLRDSDVMSMAHGLELRVPFVDTALFDSMARLPEKIRIRRGKQLLAEAVPEIPAWVRERPKRGFLFPFADWIETPQWKPLFDEALRGIPVPATAWYQRWSVFIFQHWRRLLGIH